MIGRIIRLIFVFAIVGLALYFVVVNRDASTVQLSPGWIITANTGVVVIVTFGLGILAATIVALYFGVKSQLREKQLLNKERVRQSFLETMLEARAYSASHEWSAAQEIWETAVRRDPTNLIARIELSRCLEGMGDPKEALKVLEAARATAPKNAEVLLRAAELNIALGNRTAALDNLALLLAERPSLRAATLARDLSEELGRIDDAIEYQERVESLSGRLKDAEGEARLAFKRITKEHGANAEQLTSALKAYVRKHGEYAPALRAIARGELELGNTESAVQWLCKAGRESGTIDYWREAVKIWQDAGNHEKALAVARLAAKETTGAGRLEAELELIKAYLSAERVEDAVKACEQFPELLAATGEGVDRETTVTYFALKALALMKRGDTREAGKIWETIATSNGNLSLPSPTGVGPRSNAPSPALSTP